MIVILDQVAPPSVDIQTGALTPGPQFSEKDTIAIRKGLLGSTAILGSVSARLLGSVASVAMSLIACECPTRGNVRPINATINRYTKMARLFVRLTEGEHLCFIFDS